jgi:hypothetical protein
MPYIKQEKRRMINPHLNMALEQCDEDGDYNYAISYIMHQWLLKLGKKYKNVNRVHGTFHSAASEFYAQVVLPYEITKKHENGPVSVLDAEHRYECTNCGRMSIHHKCFHCGSEKTHILSIKK